MERLKMKIIKGKHTRQFKKNMKKVEETGVTFVEL